MDVELIPKEQLSDVARHKQGSLLLYTGRLRNRSGRRQGSSQFNGKMHVMEHAFNADFAIVKAWKEIRREFNI
jgi:3-oxoacid CoA-transferase subunit A